MDAHMLNKKVSKYQKTRLDDDFNEIYQDLAIHLAKIKATLKKSYKLDEHEAESIINLRLVKTVSAYDITKGDFIGLLLISIRNECIDTVRRRPKYQVIDNTYYDDAGRMLNIFEDLLIKDYTRNAEEEISIKLIKENDQRQLIARMFEKTDTKSQQALIAFSECGSFYKASKKLGTCNKTIERRIRKVAKLFDGNRMGSIYDYFTVSTRGTSREDHNLFLR